MDETQRAEQDGLFPADMPNTFVQWKGTDVCMDFECKCGAGLHIDAMFVYSIECGHCHRVYVMGDRVAVFDVTGTPAEATARDSTTMHTAMDPDTELGRA